MQTRPPPPQRHRRGLPPPPPTSAHVASNHLVRAPPRARVLDFECVRRSSVGEEAQGQWDRDALRSARTAAAYATAARSRFYPAQLFGQRARHHHVPTGPLSVESFTPTTRSLLRPDPNQPGPRAATSAHRPRSRPRRGTLRSKALDPAGFRRGPGGKRSQRATPAVRNVRRPPSGAIP